MGKTVEYELVIKTANKMWSGTDNDVYIIVYGEVDGEEVHTDEINLSPVSYTHLDVYKRQGYGIWMYRRKKKVNKQGER